ncbi:MAG: hypothetical protein JXR64_13715 [Spirochaetales bacterium]|nr:hypothetical protein [Spirochaetales bacterium]
MKLLKLYSNRDKFKTVNFNTNALTVIIGADHKKEKITNEDQEKTTYNGTGKTLILVLVDFCLLSNKMDFLSPLKCDISLDFIEDGIIHTITRSTENQDRVIIDNVPYDKITDARKKLEEILNFDAVSQITLRSLLPYYLRYRKSAFINPIDPGDGSKEHTWNYIVAYLLNLDIQYSKEKIHLMNKLEEQKKVKRTLQSRDVKQ